MYPKLTDNEPLTPWAHQTAVIKEAIESIEKGWPYYALFHEMGCGKTGSAIGILREIYRKQGRILRTLIICPPSIVPNWKREFALHSRCSEFVVPIMGTKAKRLKCIQKLFVGGMIGGEALQKIAAINFEAIRMQRIGKSKRTMPGDILKALLDWAPEVVVIDESQRIKNASSMQAKACYALGDQSNYRYMLTGTPLLNDILDIHGQFRFLDKGERFGDSAFVFKKRYMVDWNASMPSHQHWPDWRLRKECEGEINKKIYEVSSRMKKDEALDLPPLVVQDIECDMGPAQAKAYKEMHKDFVTYIADDAAIAQTALTKSIRLQQIVTGFVTKDDGEIHEFDKVPRLDILMELVSEIITHSKTIIWATYKVQYKMIERELKKRNINYTYIYGGQKADDRQFAIDEFQENPDVKVVLAAPRAAGVGLGLQSASYMIYYSRSFSYEDDAQSEARAHRGGSEIHKKITRINLFCKDTIDEVKARALNNKENLAQNILKIRKYI